MLAASMLSLRLSLCAAMSTPAVVSAGMVSESSQLTVEIDVCL
jgi:hypothetical protein